MIVGVRRCPEIQDSGRAAARNLRSSVYAFAACDPPCRTHHRRKRDAHDVAPPSIAIPCSILIGFMYASLTFLGHEIAHGASIRPGRMRSLITYLSFAIYCVSPHLWEVWHNRAHHAHTNVEARDPDNFGTLRQFECDHWFSRLMVRFAPGSGYCTSALYLCLFFTLQGQGVLWLKSRSSPDFCRLRRRRAALDSAALAGFWILVGVLAGPSGALFVVVIPMLVSNFVVMSYIVTNHMLCPMAPSRHSQDHHERDGAQGPRHRPLPLQPPPRASSFSCDVQPALPAGEAKLASSPRRSLSGPTAWRAL